MLSRDAILEGAKPAEVEALMELCESPDAPLPLHIARRLREKGWIDTVADTHLVTLTGRTLVEMQ